MPYLTNTGSKYQTCCGRVICSGCIHAPLYDSQGNEVDNKKCPFCRTPTPRSDEESDKMVKRRIEAGDATAIHIQGCFYYHGKNGFTQDYAKALEFYNRAAELGYADAYCSIGCAYLNGRGVEADKEKAKHYWKLAAIRGNVEARHILGVDEENAGNVNRALKHYMIAVGGGYDDSLKRIKVLYTYGQASKEDYMKALQSYQTYLSEIKSSQRDKAAAANDRYRYY